MTYGPPNQGGYNVAGPQSGYPGQPLPPAPGGVGAKLTAATSSKSMPLMIVGIIIAVLGLAVVIFSFVGPWQTLKIELVKQYDGSSDGRVGDYTSVGVTGLKSVSATCSVTGMDSEEVDECEDSSRDDIESDFTPEGEDDERPILASAAGGWTLGFGIAAILASLPLIFRRYQGVGALAGSVCALAVTICAIVFSASKGAGVVDGDFVDLWEGDDNNSSEYTEWTANLGWGLITVLVASILLLVSAIAAVVLVFQGRPGVAGAPQGLGGYGQPVAVYEQSGPMYGQSGPQYGYPQPGGSQPVQYGQTQLNPNAGSGGVPPQPGYGTPSQPNQYGQTQYNQYPGQNYQ